MKCPETVTLNEMNVIRNINNLIFPQAFSAACQSDARRVGLRQEVMAAAPTVSRCGSTPWCKK